MCQGRERWPAGGVGSRYPSVFAFIPSGLGHWAGSARKPYHVAPA